MYFQAPGLQKTSKSVVLSSNFGVSAKIQRVRIRTPKKSISDPILDPKTRRKSIETRVRKRGENRAKSEPPFLAFFTIFGDVWRPNSKVTVGWVPPFFGHFLTLFSTPKKDRRRRASRTPKNRIFTDFGPKSRSRARFNAIALAESRSRSHSGRFSVRKTAETRA